MSVVASIYQPKSKSESEFSFPICTESTYRKIIFPIAKRLGLSLFCEWGSMVEINIQNSLEFSRQLNIFIIEMCSLIDIDQNFKLVMKDRFFEIEKKIHELIENREDIEIFIG